MRGEDQPRGVADAGRQRGARRRDPIDHGVQEARRDVPVAGVGDLEAGETRRGELLLRLPEVLLVLLAARVRAVRGERPDQRASARISGAERVVVVTVLLAAAAFEIWFFFFSGSSIGDEMKRTCGASSKLPPWGVLAGMTHTSPALTGRVTPPTRTSPVPAST